MPVRSGPICVPSPAWMWHLAHWFLKTTLPAAASPFSFVSGSSSSSTFCRSGVGSPPPFGQQLLRPPADGLVGVVGQGLLLVERQVERATVPFSTASSSGPRPSGRASRTPMPPRRAARPAAGRPGVPDQPPATGPAGRAGLEQAGGQLRRRARRDQVEQRSRRRPSSARNSTSSRAAAATLLGAARLLVRASSSDLGTSAAYFSNFPCCPSRRPA